MRNGNEQRRETDGDQIKIERRDRGSEEGRKVEMRERTWGMKTKRESKKGWDRKKLAFLPVRFSRSKVG